MSHEPWVDGDLWVACVGDDPEGELSQLCAEVAERQQRWDAVWDQLFEMARTGRHQIISRHVADRLCEVVADRRRAIEQIASPIRAFAEQCARMAEGLRSGEPPISSLIHQMGEGLPEPSPDASAPDTSQPYFLDLIRRIDEVT